MIQKISSSAPCGIAFKSLNVSFSKDDHMADVGDSNRGNVDSFHKMLGDFQEAHKSDKDADDLLNIRMDKYTAGAGNKVVRAIVSYGDAVIESINQNARFDPRLKHIYHNTDSEDVYTSATANGEDFFEKLGAVVAKYKAKALDRMDPGFYTREAKVQSDAATRRQMDDRHDAFLDLFG